MLNFVGRPLTQEMFNYARADTHFLLYIYDKLRNELIEMSDLSEPHSNLIDSVMIHSKEECLQRYERPLYDKRYGLGSMGWYNALNRTPALFNREQFSIFRAVHHWRDTVAREEDEGVHSIMPKHVLYKIARDVPTDMATLLGCSHPMSKSFRKRKGSLLSVVRQARNLGSSGPEMKDLMQSARSLLAERNSSDAELLQDEEKAIPQAVSKFNNAEQGTTYLMRPIQNGRPSQSELRTNHSCFWGSESFDYEGNQEQLHKGSEDNIRLHLPLPMLTSGLYANSEATAVTCKKTFTADASGDPQPDQMKGSRRMDNVFIISNPGRMRKRRNLEMTTSNSTTRSQEDSANSSDRENEKMTPEADLYAIDDEKVKADLKMMKGARKEDHKAQIQQRALTSREGSEVPAFDYANAPSVLHSHGQGANYEHGSRDSAGESKPEDPYQKSLDAPKGARKINRELHGKAQTFRS